ncbi:hypothetical protein NKR19_g7233 [Coniochaeta hoffmannii]|uniref:Ankyrin repeat-containing domain protein n=1 Tax=Coniochaeta hoffmannii TaxID=91930 RepID=A0AA38RTT6_9PEZI|nr:hypothetical protein NKR19_g7233 [Coniochaeta hoffmannii]
MALETSSATDEGWNNIALPGTDGLVVADGSYQLNPTDAVTDAVVSGTRAYEAAPGTSQFYSAHHESIHAQADNIIIGQVENLHIHGPEPVPPPVPSKPRLDDKVKRLLLKRTDPSMQGYHYSNSYIVPINLALKQYGNTSSSSKKIRCATILKYLILTGANLEIRTATNETPLIALAAMSGPHSLLIIICEIMNERGHADFVNRTDTHGVTALHAILRQRKSSAVRKGVNALLGCGADPNLVPSSRDSRTPLELVLPNKDYGTMKALLEHGADPNTATTEDKTLLYSCVSSKDVSAVKLLLEHGANPNIGSPGASNQLPIHAAVTAKSLELVKLLIAKGSELDVQDDSDKAPLIYAVDQDSLPLTEALLEGGADPNVTVRNSETGYLEWSVLSFAMWQRKQPAVARALIEWAADVDHRNGTYEETALHIAAYAGDVELVRLLIDKEADVEARSNNNYSALGIAIESGHARTAKVLIEEGGADVNVRDGNYRN